MKKHYLILILLLASGIVGSIKAQLPNVAHTNFSTKDGEVTDSRDGKTYAYKKYGSYYWLMQNLNWDGFDGVNEKSRGTVGHWGSADPDESKFGRFYKTGTVAGVCPAGWTSAGHGSFKDLVNVMNSDYGASIRLEDASGWTILDAMQNLRGGGLKSQGGIWEDETSEEGVTDPDPMADQIQFNMLPAGGFDGKNYITGEEVGKKAYIMLDGNDRFQNNTANTRHKKTSLRHVRTADTYGMVRCLKVASDGAPIITPYPTTLDIKQVVSSDAEKIRMGHTMRKYDHTPTGFYIAKGKKLEINVEQLQAATDGSKIQVVVGTPALISPDNNTQTETVKAINLSSGLNTILPDQHSGGMVYFRYVSHKDSPQGKAKVTFTNNSEQERVPHYKYGTTTDSEFLTMLSEYSAPEVMYSSDYLIVVVSKAASLSNSINVKKDIWIEELEKLVEIEDEISGMDNNDPNPIHHRLKKGEVRHLLVQTTPDSPPNASDERTAFPDPAFLLSHIQRPSRPQGIESWMLGHELGHQHQQSGYLIPLAGESTVNIYSIKVRTYFENAGELYVRTPQTKIENNISKYLALPDDKRVYEMNSDDIESITGINRDEVRMVPWEQFYYIFGDQFYKTLHRITREEKQLEGSVDERKTYIITRTSLISGYDMRDFFDAWGIKVTEPYYQTIIDKAIADANLEKPARWNELAGIGGEKYKNGDYNGWLPLQLKGITSSTPPTDDDQPADRLAAKEKYCDYTAQTGIITDARDQKQYPYKQIGSYDWFMTNLDWDGYDGKDIATQGTSGLYSIDDPQGKVYGRYYATYANHEEQVVERDDPEKWCPEGWRYANGSDFDRLMADVQKEFDLASIPDAVKCLKCGGDRDVEADGLWRKGAGEINTTLAAQLGINFLPAGVVRLESRGYDPGDEDGKKASFVNSGWYHDIYRSSSNSKDFANRFFEHYGSVRCARLATNLKTQEITFNELGTVQVSTEDFDPEITATSGLPVTMTSSNINVATIAGNKIHIVGIGTTSITATQEGNSEYHAAESKSRLLTVVPRGIDENEVWLTINGEEGF